MYRKITLIALILCVGRIAFCQKIYDKDAFQHIGETQSVSGRVNSFKVLTKSKVTLLYCGVYYPEKYFTVVVNKIPEGNTNPKDWSISVTGVIFIYKGMPAIKVAGWGQVQHVLFVDRVPNDI